MRAAPVDATMALFVGTTNGLAIYRYSAQHRDWRRVGDALAGSAIRALVAVDELVLLCAAQGLGTQQSFDGGATWVSCAAAPPQPIGLQVATIHGPAPLANPRLSGATAYARLAGAPAMLIGAGAGGMMLFLSDDDGIHWTPARIDGSYSGVTSLIPASDRASGAWAGTRSGAILRSDDRGQHWRLVATESAPILCLAAAG